MKVENSVIPTQEQMAGFMSPGPDGPISMVNLLKFKEKAVYKDGRETELTGQEAYALYSRGVMKTLATVGGKLVFSGDVSRLMLGEVEDRSPSDTQSNPSLKGEFRSCSCPFRRRHPSPLCEWDHGI